MQTYKEPFVKKLNLTNSDLSTKKTNCSGSNARKMPDGSFVKKDTKS